MKVLLIGSGGREHTLAWKLSKSPRLTRLLAAPGSDAIAELGQCYPISVNDTEALRDLAKREAVDLVVIGPEAPLVNGLVDVLRAEGIACIGPNKAAAQLEGSKVFAKEVMAAAGVPTARYARFSQADQAKAYIEQTGAPLVVKADGLAAGKGVLMCRTTEEALQAVDDILVNRQFGDAGNELLIEQWLEGEEASFIAITDGETVLPFASSQDHKRVFDEDEGPNTGGMGAYSPAPVVTTAMHKKIMDQVMIPVVKEMKNRGIAYRGFLYAGLMIADDTPYVLEFNCRFGDPETQPVLYRLKTDLLEIFQATQDGILHAIDPVWDPRPAVCVVLASGGYPGSYDKGVEIRGLNKAGAMDDVLVFHAGTRKDGETWRTAGGRVLGVTAKAPTIEAATEHAYQAVGQIQFDKMHFRKDIAKRAFGRVK